MRNEKILILESSWAERDKEYISDSRSSSRIYRGVESLLSTGDNSILIINRPLLTSRFTKDINLFLQLPCNRKGINIVIISGHGKHKLLWDPKGLKKHRRIIESIDGELNISTEVRELKGKLSKTIFILDSCYVGQNPDSFLKASRALGFIGFQKRVNWIPSVIFILALLSHFHEERVFNSRNSNGNKLQNILERMKSGTYLSIMKELGVAFRFLTS
jgi:hypothetical protein